MDISSLHTNQRLLLLALEKYGATFRLLDSYEELIEISCNGKKDFLLDRFSSQVPYHVVKMSADKHFAKKLFSDNHISNPIGQIFTSHTSIEALNYASTIYPVVLKPNWGSHGDNVQVNIKDQAELEKAISLFISKTSSNEPFIIEKFYPWNEYRLFITNKNGFAVVHRQCASIIGDDILSIQELIKKENTHRIHLKNTVNTALCPIVIDSEVTKYLAEHNIHSLDYIPQYNEQVFLRQESNLAKGGKAIDMTDITHPSIKQLAIQALTCFPGLPVAGLDLLCHDITQPISPDNYVIIEINSNPGLAMHTYPTEGQSRDVAQLLLDVMFPHLILNN